MSKLDTIKKALGIGSAIAGPLLPKSVGDILNGVSNAVNNGNSDDGLLLVAQHVADLTNRVHLLELEVEVLRSK